MVKFLCGMTLGVLFAVAFCYCDSQNKIGGIILGALVGAALIVVTAIAFLQSLDIPASRQEKDDKWWMTGGKPPWEENEDD